MPLDRKILIAVSLLAAGCTGSSDISKEIARQTAMSGEARVDLRTVAGPEWERVCFLGPYSGTEQAEKTLGFPWNVESRTPISGSDGINVLIFVRAQEVVDYTEHSRHQDFWRLSGQCFDRDKAVFVNKDGFVPIRAAPLHAAEIEGV
jgi:hypothetical protein